MQLLILTIICIRATIIILYKTQYIASKCQFYLAQMVYFFFLSQH